MPKPTLFDQTALNQALERTLQETPLPAGHVNAVVGMVDATGAQFLVSLQREEFGASWQIQGLIRHEWAGDTSVGGRVLVSW